MYENEPDITAPLIGLLKGAVLLPHIGSATIEGRLEMGDKVIINIQTFWDGHTPRDRVIEAMLNLQCRKQRSLRAVQSQSMKPPFLPSNAEDGLSGCPMPRISLTASSA